MRYWLVLLLLSLPTPGRADEPKQPTAQDLLDRHAKEKSSVWADGDMATFFYRGETEQVTLLVGGEMKQMKRLAGSDVWTLTFRRPGLEKGIFSYFMVAHKKDAPAFPVGTRIQVQYFRGPKAPPGAAKQTLLKGMVKEHDFASAALGGTRKVRVYLPPGHDKTKRYPVVFATDGQDNAHLVEALITAGKVPPLIVVAAANGGYLGDRSAKADMTKDLRAMEYLTGIDKERYGKHEKFFCEELRAWAEKEYGASPDRKDRGVMGCSNGARFAVDMGARHPDLFGHVFAFSVAGRREFKLPAALNPAPHFHLAAGVWEEGFHKTTVIVTEELKKQSVPVTFHSRVAGHDSVMWEDEFAAALVRAFGKGT
jgi:enterochelin esterase-like enzyme